MSPFTCISTLLVIGLILMPSLNAETLFGNEEDGALMNQVRELLAELRGEETTRAVDADVLKEEIDALNGKYTGLFANKDVQGILDMYEPDALRISYGEATTGLEEYKAEVEGWIKYVDRAVINTKVLVQLDRDAKFVFERKWFSMYGPTSEEPINEEWNIIVWKLTDAGYKIAVELVSTA